MHCLLLTVTSGGGPNTYLKRRILAYVMNQYLIMLKRVQIVIYRLQYLWLLCYKFIGILHKLLYFQIFLALIFLTISSETIQHG